MKCLICLLSFLSLFETHAQGSEKPGNRIDLEDVKIKGEANKGGVNFTKRSRHSLDDRIHLRKDFTKEVIENLPSDFNSKK